MKSVSKLAAWVLICSALPLFSQTGVVSDPCSDWSIVEDPNSRREAVCKFVEVTIKFTARGRIEKSIRNRFLALLVTGGFEAGLKILKILFECESCNDMFCRRDVMRGQIFECGDTHCVEDGVQYEILSIEELNYNGKKVKIHLLSIQAPRTFDEELRLPEDMNIPDLYIEVWEGNNLKKRTITHDDVRATSVYEACVVNFAQSGTIQILLKDEDLVGEDDLLCGISLSESIRIGQELKIRLPCAIIEANISIVDD